MAKFPWLKISKKANPEPPLTPPLLFGNWSNGEIFMPAGPKERLMQKLVLERSESKAKKLGMDRREFLASTAGYALCLAVINQVNGCSGSGGDGTTKGGNPNDSGSGGGPKLKCDDTPYVVPTEATCAETEYLTPSPFIFDIQTHSFDQGEWREKNPAITDFLSNSIGRGGIGGTPCSEPEVLDCFNRNHYGELMFVESDTTMAVITSWPANTCTKDKDYGCGLPLSNQGMEDLREWVNNNAMSQRVVNQIQVMPNDVWPHQKEIMTMTMEDPAFRAVSWKCYPAWKSDSYRPQGLPAGYFLNEDIGQAFIQHGLDLCVNNFAVHKGLSIPGFDIEHNQAIDVGPAAKMFPKANFIIYHSAINAGCGASTNAMMVSGAACSENVPYDPNDQNPRGLNQLVKSMLDNGIGPNQNVFGELGSAWASVATNTTAAQHFLGKLLKYVGEDNICWGTDSILLGSPQWQIGLFKAFQITQQFQDQYGYPAMTETARAKIFGLNAARLFRIDPEKARCKAQTGMFASAKNYMDGEYGDRRWTVRQPLGPRTRREFLALARMNIAKGVPG